MFSIKSIANNKLFISSNLSFNKICDYIEFKLKSNKCNIKVYDNNINKEYAIKDIIDYTEFVGAYND